MKIGFLFLLTHFLFIKIVRCASVKAPLDIITLEDITPEERKHLHYLNSLNEPREKRSSQGILSLLGKGSASASSHGSSSSGGYYDHHPEPEEYDHKSFDFWGLKKSILNTLLQTAKAIKGAAIAVTGKLIKGSGYLVSAKGKLISAKGEAVSELGKKIASSAVLSPGHKQYHSASYSEHPHDEYHSEYHHDAHVSPSSSASGYDHPPPHFPEKYTSVEDDSPHKTLHGIPSGIIILKKIPHHYQEAQESVKIPDFKPLEPRKPQGPTFTSLLTNIFTSSSHAQPHTPETHHADHYSNSPPPKPPSDEHDDDLPSIKPITEEKPLDKPIHIDNTPFPVQTYFPSNSLIDLPQDQFPDFSTHPGFYLNNLAANINTLPNIQTLNGFPTQFSTEYLNTQFPVTFQNLESSAFNTIGPNSLQDPRSVKQFSTFRTTPLTSKGPLTKLPNLSSSLSHKHVKRAPTRLSPISLNSPPGYELLKSLSFQLGPQGPVKI